MTPRLAVVGRMFMHAFHAKSLDMLGTWRFQSWLQNQVCSMSWDVSANAEVQVMDIATLYALLTMKRPFGVYALIMQSYGLW